MTLKQLLSKEVSVTLGSQTDEHTAHPTWYFILCTAGESTFMTVEQMKQETGF